MNITWAQIRKAAYDRYHDIGTDEVIDLVGSAEENANDTIYLEKTVSEEHFDEIALSSLELNLGCCRDEAALAWFRALGVKW
jgi:hypothetical protein